MKKNIVVMSGGNGSFITINALKSFIKDIELSAVIPMSDSGGSSGRLRTEFGVLPMGDIMRAVLAMSRYDSEMLKSIFYRTRFHDAGKLSDHNLGNLFLVLAEKYDGNFLHALGALHQALDTVGTAHPVTIYESDLVASLADGQMVKGEHEIDRPREGQRSRIQKLSLDPVVEASPGSMKALEEADIIMFGPGSLYCSVIATLLPAGVREAIDQNKNATLIFVGGGAYEKDGEVGPRVFSETISELEQYLPRPLDQIIYNNHELSKEEHENYKKRDWETLEYDEKAENDTRILAADYEKPGGGLSSEKLGLILKKALL